MITIPHKAKQFLTFLIKLLIVGGAFYFIWDQLANNEKLDWNQFLELLDRKKSFWGILFILSFSFFNRFFEILKWQNLVQVIEKISVSKATEQVLSALTASIFTPNGIGEYGAKALYFEKKEAKKIVFLNLICNGIQMILTIIFGAVGLLILGYGKWVLVISGIAFFLIVASFLFKKITIKGYSLNRLFEKINEIPKPIHQKNIFLAVCRYLIFSHQYYFLFLAFDVDLPYWSLMASISSVYFLASSLPTFQFLDFAVKGSVAVYFFGNLGINDWIVVFISTLIWFLNVVLPVLIGSFYVFKFKSKWKV
ncbi:lysylphosphatidylglycerol synthase domain-containing protein [Flavobacterium macacae]|uniref:Uncharacterized protein n=1 Tax=Flavobacterium macacae TaxID=2488993 RepID=A0A3P3WH14_9FLAO|nr:lysylphosphatidylglycerol synthase domain-containing protein [Flavobacterium macacae]RRJ93807.1 hypothetical protein EG849_02930 [Flavobacterium macacae]